MDLDATDFPLYVIDCAKYSANIDLVTQQLNYLREINNNLPLTPSQLNEKIEENRNIVNKSTKEIAEKQNELIKLKQELHLLEFNEIQAQRRKKVHDDAIGSTHIEQIRGTVTDLTLAAAVLETRLGFKLKLTKCEDNNQNLWLAKFFFDANPIESSKYVVIQVDVTTSSFKLVDMKPMPLRYREMQHFLVETNDVTGLLANCYTYFKPR